MKTCFYRYYAYTQIILSDNKMVKCKMSKLRSNIYVGSTKQNNVKTEININ